MQRGRDSAVVRARKLSSSCFSCYGHWKNHDEIKLLKSHLENFCSSEPFLSNSNPFFYLSCRKRHSKLCWSCVWCFYSQCALLKDDYLCLFPPLECLLRGCGWQPKGQLKAGDHSLPVFFITNVCLEGLRLLPLLELIFLGRIQVFIWSKCRNTVTYHSSHAVSITGRGFILLLHPKEFVCFRDRCWEPFNSVWAL